MLGRGMTYPIPVVTCGNTIGYHKADEDAEDSDEDVGYPEVDGSELS
jgi:hypothetical protein